jgi:hypothetical protein
MGVQVSRICTIFYGESVLEIFASFDLEKIRSYMFDTYVGTQTRKLPIPVRGSTVPVLVPVLVQAAPYSIIH